MVTEHKKRYMKRYNQQSQVKAKKAEYMRKIRAAKDAEASRNLVRTLLELGHEQLAFEYAQERAPDMLLTVKTSARKK